MKRTEIEAEYTVRDGTITSPGKFEGEPVYAPYFWFAGLEGFADEDEDGQFIFVVSTEDRAEFPELVGIDRVVLEESETGFVYCYARESEAE